MSPQNPIPGQSHLADTLRKEADRLETTGELLDEDEDEDHDAHVSEYAYFCRRISSSTHQQSLDKMGERASHTEVEAAIAVARSYT